MGKQAEVLSLMIILALSLIPADASSLKRIEVIEAPISENSTDLALNSSWGPPGDGIFDLEGEVLLIPFFEYQGTDFVLGTKRPGNSTINMVLNSTSPDRTLESWMVSGHGLLRTKKDMDVILRDDKGNLYGIPLDPDRRAPHPLGESDIIYTGTDGEIAMGDVTGDDINDIVHLSPDGGSLDFFEGPHPSSQGRAVLNLPLEMDNIASGMDLTGDGISEIVMWTDSGSGSTILIYYGLTLTPMAVLESGERVTAIDHGDLDGNGIDDLILRTPVSAPHGRIKILPGENVGFDTDIDGEGLNLLGNVSVPFDGSERIMLKDLDGDQADDLIIGLPGNDGGRGRLMIRYGDPSRNLSGNLPLDPDAVFIGEDPGDALGEGIYFLEDHNGDHLPDIFLGIGNGLRQLDIPENILPFEIQSLEFQREDGSDEIATAEQGDTVRIVCEAAGGDVTEPDIIKARVVASREEGSTESWVHLREIDNSSGVYIGRLLLASASVPGRSIGVVQNDIVDISVLDFNGSGLLIKGFEDQEDPPYFIEGNTSIKMMEDSTLNEVLIFTDPDGDPLRFSHPDAPEWINFAGPVYSGGLYEFTVYGIPDNGNVGWNNFTLTASSRGTNTTVDISIYVANRVPMIEAFEAPGLIEEGSEYRAVFDLKEEGGTISTEITSNGNDTWLDISEEGMVTGIPGNRHTGSWTFNLTLDDGNGGIDWYTWNVVVSNLPPNLIMPDISNCTEKVPLTLDFQSQYEGDGLTAYMITISIRENAILNSDGLIEIIPDITDTDTISIDVWVEDGNGASTNGSMEILIINSPAVLLNQDILPERLIAGTQYSFDLESDEEGEIWDSTPRFFYRFESNPLTGPEGLGNTDGRISVRPWNMDSGNHSISIELLDWNNPDPFVHKWNFTVLNDASFRDPWLDFEIKGKRGSKLVVEMDHGGDLPVITIGSFVTNSTSQIGTGSKQDPEEGDTLEVDFSMFSGDVIVVGYIIVNNTQDGTRRLNHTLEVDLDNVKKLEDDGEFPFFALILIFFTILIIIILILSLFIERTSFPLQLALLKGGEIRVEEVLSKIQDMPGIGFAELQKRSEVPRRDLIATIDHLEKNGMARAVVDGLGVKFLPMMGAFVDGPLALNRYQRKILDILYKARKLNATEISEASGYSEKKVDRELTMLELKGSVTGRSTSEGKEYQLTGKQKMRMRRQI